MDRLPFRVDTANGVRYLFDEEVSVETQFTVANRDPVGDGSTEDLFQVIRVAMDNDPYFLSAEYDQNYGHPVIIQLDQVAGRTDDNVVYTSLTLTPVE